MSPADHRSGTASADTAISKLPTVPDAHVPLVSVLITARNRGEELAATLSTLRTQTYGALEVIVIDDASDESLEAVVAESYPSARFFRNERNIGLIASRSLGMRIASGDFIVSLDDDSNFIADDAIERAVRRVLVEPEVGILRFHKIDAAALPDIISPQGVECYAYGYNGCAHMLSTRMVRQLGGYRDFFYYYSEEAEYSIRALAAGWRILYMPSVVVHHRVSPVGRSNEKIRAYSFRNNLWILVLHMPLRRLIPELIWKVLVHAVYTVRFRQYRWSGWALKSFLSGLPQAMQFRAAMTGDALRRLDLLRVHTVRSSVELSDLRPSNMARLRWLVNKAVMLRRV